MHATVWRREPAGRMARQLLVMSGWGLQGPVFRQGAVGTSHFEPGGVSFWDFPGGPLATASY